MTWHKTDEKPKDGETIVIAVWYDWWNYDIGHYIAKTNQFQSRILPPDAERFDFEDVDVWAEFEEPKSL